MSSDPQEGQANPFPLGCMAFSLLAFTSEFHCSRDFNFDFPLGVDRPFGLPGLPNIFPVRMTGLPAGPEGMAIDIVVSDTFTVDVVIFPIGPMLLPLASKYV